MVDEGNVKEFETFVNDEVDINIRDNENHTILDYAKGQKKKKIKHWLKENGAVYSDESIGRMTSISTMSTQSTEQFN